MLTRGDAKQGALVTELQPLRAANAGGIRNRILGALQGPRGGWLVAGMGLALCLPALSLGFMTDDHLHRSLGQTSTDPLSLFKLSSTQAAYLRSIGELAWWSSPQLSIHFLRPLSTLTHLAEFHLWPDAAWAMHLASGLIYAALCGLAWLLYREFLPHDVHVAAIAALMFAIDEAHAPAVGWISSRNTVLASLFGFAAVLLHARSRKLGASGRGPEALSRQLRLHWGAALCFALALLSAEAGVGVFAYLIAYAVAFESGSLAKRLITLSPELVILVCWMIMYIAGGFGAHSTSFYRDVANPLLVLSQGILDVPAWLLALLGPSVVGGAIVAAPAIMRVVSLIVVVPLIAGIAVALPRTRENVFFALGALLSLPAVFTTQPQERLLMTAGFGAFGLIASFISAAAVRASRFARATRWVLIACHLVIAPLLFIPTLGQSMPFERGARAIAELVREHPASHVVIVNLPIELLTLYVPALLSDDPANPQPKSIHQLYAGESPIAITRIDANTLEVRAVTGWGTKTLERVFCAESDLPPAGRKLAFDAIAIGVMENDNAGHPTRVQFKFEDAVDAPGRLWLRWRGKHPVVWTPPAIGQTEAFDALGVFKSFEM
jgi:hypothetical protein